MMRMAKPRAGEGLTPHQALRQAQGNAQLAYFVLKEPAQGLDNFLKVHAIRQTAYVVVTLDNGALTAQATLHHIGINGSLRQEIHLPDLFRLFFKYADKFFAYYFTLLFRFCYTGKLAVVTLLSVYTNKI